MKTNIALCNFHSFRVLLSRFLRHQNQVGRVGMGGTGAFGPNLILRLFSRSFGIQLATLNRDGRLGGVWQVRSSIAFSQTLHGPRGHPRDWASEQSAFEHCRFSSFQTSCTYHFPLLNQRDNMSSYQCSRKALMCAKPFGSEIVYLQRRGFGLSAKGGNEKRRIVVLRTDIRERTSGTF